MKVLLPAEFGRGVRIAATGAYFPARVVDNAELVALGAPLTPEEIERTTGIRTRHWVGPEEATSDLAAAAARQVLTRAGLDATTVERLVLATVSPDHPTPSTACFVHALLGLHEAPASDVVAACSGFIYALEDAARAVLTGEQHVLVAAADVRSRFLDPTDRTTCALFGDGAGAALVEPGELDSGLLAITTLADGRGARSVYIPAGGSREPASRETLAAGRHTIHMADGAQVYLAAVEGMFDVARRVLDATRLTFADIDWLVPHQANFHIVKRVAWKAGIPLDRVALNLDRRGNTSGATVPTAFDELLTSGRVGVGDRVLLVAAGAGHTAGAALYRVDAALLSAVTR